MITKKRKTDFNSLFKNFPLVLLSHGETQTDVICLLNVDIMLRLR